MNLTGSRILITGGARGLGLAIAREAGHAGACLVLTDVDSDGVQSAVGSLRAGGIQAAGYTLDVTRVDDILEVRRRIAAEQGPIDILINNAGVVFGGPFSQVPIDRHITTAQINLSGVLAVTHAFLRDLLARPRAAIVNIASASALVPLPGAASYAATKAAVLAFTDSLREELRVSGHRHVSLTALCPSYISTGMFAGARPARMTWMLTPESVARAVVRAIERERQTVILPWTASLLHVLTRWLPRRWQHRLFALFGVSHGMDRWQGHKSGRNLADS